jgi:hypothetical protein
VTEHDRARLRTTGKVLLLGPLLGVTAAGAVALIGLPGQAGFLAVVLGCALGAVLAALTTVGHAIVDEWARRPVARRRIVIAVGLFLAATVLLIASGGLAGG